MTSSKFILGQLPQQTVPHDDELQYLIYNGQVKVCCKVIATHIDNLHIAQLMEAGHLLVKTIIREENEQVLILAVEWTMPTIYPNVLEQIVCALANWYSDYLDNCLADDNHYEQLIY